MPSGAQGTRRRPQGGRADEKKRKRAALERLVFRETIDLRRSLRHGREDASDDVRVERQIPNATQQQFAAEAWR
jgi:hypothetical protein